MWATFDEADFGLRSDGWTRDKLYVWTKPVSGRLIRVVLVWQGGKLVPEIHD